MKKLMNYFSADQFGEYTLVTISRSGIEYLRDIWPDCRIRPDIVRFEFRRGNLTACSLEADEYDSAARFLEDMAQAYADIHANGIIYRI